MFITISLLFSMLAQIMQQNRRIERLAADHSSMMKAIGQSRVSEYFARLREQVLTEAQEQRTKAMDKARILEQNIHICREEREAIVEESRKDFSQIAELGSILSRAKFAIQQALLVDANYVARCSTLMPNHLVLTLLFKLITGFYKV